MPKKKEVYRGDDDERNSVYMFHNERYDVHLFTNVIYSTLSSSLSI